MGYLTIRNDIRPIKATEVLLDKLSKAAALGLKGDSLALASGLRPHQLNALIQNDPDVEMIVEQARVMKVVALAHRLDAASEGGDVKATMTLLNKLTDGDWDPKPQAASFGAGGITINISSVKPLVEVEGSVVDG